MITPLATVRPEVPLGLTAGLATVIGLFIGSFLNVVVYRVPRHLSVSSPRSFCPTCRRQLSWWENVPLASWLALRGRCHVCKQPISARYPIMEAGNAAAFGLVTLAWHGSALAVAYCVLAATLLSVVIIDVGPIRSPLSVAGVGTGIAEVALVAGGAWAHRWSVVVGAQVGLAVGSVVFLVLRRIDPECLRPEGYGRTALVPAGCWLGGLGAVAAGAGVAGGVVVLGASLLLRRATTPSTTAGTSAGGGVPTAAEMGRSAGGFLRLPLVAATTAAVVVGLVVFW
jgi:leader peptidase (prepilin peptidase)/N-methyltransferase